MITRVIQHGGAIPPGFPVLSACTGEKRMTYGRGGGQPPWEDDPQYAPQGYGQQHPEEQPWQPEQYDPYAHERRVQGAPQEVPWQQAPPPQDYPARGPWQPPQPAYPQQHQWRQPGTERLTRQDFPMPPQQTHHRRRSRWPLYGGIAALVVVAGGGAAYALTGHSTPASPAVSANQAAAKPETCKHQFTAWRTGPAKTLAQSFKADGNAVQSAGNSEDIPQMDAALKKIGDDAVQLEQYPMPACADPAGDWTQILAGIKAVGDNASSTPGLGGIVAAEAPMQHVQALETKLNTELERTVGVKSAI
jgi:hypothetical protein